MKTELQTGRSELLAERFAAYLQNLPPCSVLSVARDRVLFGIGPVRTWKRQTLAPQVPFAPWLAAVLNCSRNWIGLSRARDLARPFGAPAPIGLAQTFELALKPGWGRTFEALTPGWERTFEARQLTDWALNASNRRGDHRTRPYLPAGPGLHC